MLGFLAGELEQRADPRIVAIEPRTRVIEHEREDEFLYQSEHCEILVAPDMIEHEPLVVGQALGRRRARERLWQERPREIERRAFGHDVVELPRRALR